MSNERRARKAKHKRSVTGSADTTLSDAIRNALAGGHPLSLLSVASMAIHVENPKR
jgi:hypothetical protein